MQLVMSNESYRFSNPTSTHADPEEAEGEEDEKEEIADELEGYWRVYKDSLLQCQTVSVPTRHSPANQSALTFLQIFRLDWLISGPRLDFSRCNQFIGLSHTALGLSRPDSSPRRGC